MRAVFRGSLFLCTPNFLKLACRTYSLTQLLTSDIVLTPTYDQVSTAIVMPEDTDELALPLNGFQKKLLSMDFVQAMENTGLTSKMAQRILKRFIPMKEKWFACIDESFISNAQKAQFKALISDRLDRIKAHALT